MITTDQVPRCSGVRLMRSREFILEYDRSRAAQTIGPNLWRAALREKLTLYALKLANFEKDFENLYPAAFRTYRHLLTNQKFLNELAEDALRQLEEVDPTTNKKYTQWLGRLFASDPATKLEDITSTIAEYLHKFNTLSRKKLLKPEHGDINRFKNLKAFMDTLDQYELPEDDSNKGKATKAYSDNDVTVIIPEDEAAACQYGRQTRWCTAATRGINYFDQYNKDGPLYILIPKSPNHQGEKYQLHFPSQQFMNENDEQQNLGWIIKQRFPKLYELFEKLQPEYVKGIIELASDEDIGTVLNAIKEQLIPKLNKLKDYWGTNDAFMSWAKSNGYLNKKGEIDYKPKATAEKYKELVAKDYEKCLKIANMKPSNLKNIIQEYNEYRDIDEEAKVYKMSDIPSIIRSRILGALDLSGKYQLTDWLEDADVKYTPNGWELVSDESK